MTLFVVINESTEEDEEEEEGGGWRAGEGAEGKNFETARKIDDYTKYLYKSTIDEWIPPCF